MGKGIEEISKMNLADLDRPGENKKEKEKDSTVLNVEAGDGKTDLTESGADSSPVKDENPFPGMEKEKMADPTGEHYTIDAVIEAKELKDFVRHHLFHTPAVLMVLGLGVILPIYTFIFQPKNLRMSLVFFVVLCIVYPIWQYKKIVDSNLKNPVYKNVFHYMVDEEGFHLEAGLRAIDIDWKDFTKKSSLKTSYVLYTGKTNAFILPRKDMGGKEEKIMAFVDRMMDSHKR